jgi:hypothetical protein
MKHFPFIHLLVLVAGGIVLFILKSRYPKIRIIEIVVIFILFFLLVALFTEQGQDLVRKFIGILQV